MEMMLLCVMFCFFMCLHNCLFSNLRLFLKTNFLFWNITDTLQGRYRVSVCPLPVYPVSANDSILQPWHWSKRVKLTLAITINKTTGLISILPVFPLIPFYCFNILATIPPWSWHKCLLIDWKNLSRGLRSGRHCPVSWEVNETNTPGFASIWRT